MCGYSLWCLQFQGQMLISLLISKELLATSPLSFPCGQEDQSSHIPPLLATESAVLVSQGTDTQQVNNLPSLCYQQLFREEGFKKKRAFRRWHTLENTQRFKKKKQQRNCEQQLSHMELSASTRDVYSRWLRSNELA